MTILVIQFVVVVGVVPLGTS